MDGFIKAVIIGTGNVATQMAKAMPLHGFCVTQVFGHTLEHAEALAKRLGASFTNNPAQLNTTADIYLYAVSDTALPDVVAALPPCEGIHLHTSGTMPMSVFETHQNHYGVLYPLQSFSKEAHIQWNEVPFFVEANSDLTLREVRSVARRLSAVVYDADSDTRRTLHLAGVLTNNFSNALYAMAGELLNEKGLPFKVLLPLLQQSVEKLQTLTPHEAQTGPALRGDYAVTNAHEAMLASHPRWQTIYRLLTEEIRETHG